MNEEAASCLPCTVAMSGLRFTIFPSREGVNLVVFTDYSIQPQAVDQRTKVQPKWPYMAGPRGMPLGVGLY